LERGSNADSRANRASRDSRGIPRNYIATTSARQYLGNTQKTTFAQPGNFGAIQFGRSASTKSGMPAAGSRSIAALEGASWVPSWRQITGIAAASARNLDWSRYFLAKYESATATSVREWPGLDGKDAGTVSQRINFWRPLDGT
jgi:hypothetical protein